MDYEKKYKDLVEKLKKAASDPNWEDERFCCVINELLPELKESEGERIRQYLLKLADRCPEDSIDFMGEVKKENVIAWLEKQGES